ncbi:serine protease svh-1-like isoform X2 [Amphibalanus amphitrite]|uniref:serine protease svh-1-like isoform X2 n=1 Tax=Amphibalanus amphitrite TaxID=1232801 RepID=UPI001C9127E2|nr:serine protease svh-1-like isoform X2 [Amphibalanus amphitrite]
MPVPWRMDGVCLRWVALLYTAAGLVQYAAGAQACPRDSSLRRTQGGSLFLELWPRDEHDIFSATCCGDLFHCTERRATCLRCGEADCDPLTERLPGCPDTSCQPFGFVCDQRHDCFDGADESHCGDIARSYQPIAGTDITAWELVIHGVSLETCAAYCFFHPHQCQVFSYSNTSGDADPFAGVTQDHQKSLGRPLYSSRCRIGCQACGLATVRRADFVLYRSTAATVELRTQLQLTRPAGDPARLLLPRHPTCGRRQAQRTEVALVDRLFGGESALRGEFPWQAQIRTFDRKLDSWVHYCGGVIVSERFVLTAAHCMTKANSEYEVVVGEYDLRVKENTERVFGVREKLNVPDYLSNGTKVGDLAVVLLDLSNRPAISFSAEVRPACLIRPEDRPPASGTPCVISGWGITVPGTRTTPSRLRGAQVPIVSDDYCSALEVYGPQFVPEKMVCAGFVAGGVDSCSGDSGGGLVCPAADGSWQVVGIVATGSDVCGAVGKPGIYTELQPYYTKILEMMKALS